MGWLVCQIYLKYIEAEKVLKANPNITRVVGYSLGGSVALELQKRYPQLQTRTYNAPVIDFTNAISPKYESNQERYRNIGDPISIFDSGARSSLNLKFMDQPNLTHQYQNLAKENSQNNILCFIIMIKIFNKQEEIYIHKNQMKTLIIRR